MVAVSRKLPLILFLEGKIVAIGERKRNLVIKEWVREIGANKYKFNVTYWPDQNEAAFSVSERVIGKGYLQIHLWRVKDGVITGTYRRSHK